MTARQLKCGMRRVHRLDELSEGRFGPRCFLGDHFLLWTTSDGLGGYSVWGHPGASEARDFVISLWRVLERSDIHPRLVVGDFRNLESVDAEAFAVVLKHIESNAEAIGRLNYREALLHGNGPQGALVSGFYDIAPRLTRARVFAGADEAGLWLGRPDLRSHLAAIEVLRRDRAKPNWLARLRQLLEDDPATASVGAASQRLGTSTRTLQRRLGQAGTTFSGERRVARLVAAKRLLVDGWKVSAVSAHIGFARVQHFSTWFRELAGVVPSKWRTHGPVHDSVGNCAFAAAE